MPNLLVSRIAREISQSSAVKIYVGNVMTQPGETNGMTAADHVHALLACAGERICDYVIVNDEPPSRLLAAYAQEGQVPVRVDADAIVALGLEPVCAVVVSEAETVGTTRTNLPRSFLRFADRAVAERATLVSCQRVPAFDGRSSAKNRSRL